MSSATAAARLCVGLARCASRGSREALRPSLLILRMLSRSGRLRVEVVGPLAEIGNEIDDLNVGLQADDLSLPGRELRQGDRHLVAGDDVGVGR